MCVTYFVVEDLHSFPHYHSMFSYLTAEEALHLHGSNDLAVEHGPVAGHEQVELLHHVQKDLVLAVLDSL